MSEIVRKLSTGIVGLDIALGGGWRVTRRIADDERLSATMLIRGGPGTGKSALATDLALRLATKLGGDVVYACVELLPQELVAQRAGFDGFDARAVIDLSTAAKKQSAVSGPTLAVGLHPIELARDGEAPEGSPLVPDVGEMLVRLASVARDRGCSPRVVVLDSLIEGYGLGSASSRYMVDGVCKLAIEQGWVLILIEEASDERPSPWSFAVDTVLSLRLIEREGLHERELSVTKHRFGPCEPGPHRLRIGSERIRVIPPVEAYRNAHRDLSLPKPSPDRRVYSGVVELVSQRQHTLRADESSGEVHVVLPSSSVSAKRVLEVLLDQSQCDDVATPPLVLSANVDLFERDDEWLEHNAHILVQCDPATTTARVVLVEDRLEVPFERTVGSDRAVLTLVRMLLLDGHIVFVVGSGLARKIPADARRTAFAMQWDSESGTLDLTQQGIGPAKYRLPVTPLWHSR